MFLIKPKIINNKSKVFKLNTFPNNKRFFSSPIQENYTVKLLTNKCSRVEIDKLKENNFSIDGEEIRKNYSKILMNSNFFKTTAISSILVGVKMSSGYYIPLITTLAKFWLYVSIPLVSTSLLIRQGRSMNFFEPNNDFLTNYKYYHASRKILKIKDDKLMCSIINITPEILIILTNRYIFEDNFNSHIINRELTSLIQNNKKFFNDYFDVYVKFICYQMDICNKIKKIVFWDTNLSSNEYKAKEILKILQRECNRKIDFKMKIKENLIFEDYNRSHFQFNEKDDYSSNINPSLKA